MQRVSEAYKEEQNQQLREEGYIWVYLGIISKEAQSCAVPHGTFTIYSQEDKTPSSVEFEAYYATPEQNMAKVDSTMYFMPRSGDAFALYQGAVTQEICAPITYTFEPYTELDLKGLTINFGDYYPTRFTVSNGSPSYTYTYENNSAGEWVCEDIFRDTSYITITPLEMVGGKQRLRIISILFGVGLTFDNYSLISTSFKSSCAHLSDSLPSKTLTFTISNLNKKFAADDPHSFVSFLQEQQEVEFDYGRKLADGSMYKIPGSKMYLNSWSSNDLEASFTATGFMDYIGDTYYNGQYYPNGITLYDLAVNICNDGGIENYVIDNYLKKLKTHNPVPIEKHKNLLQLIANASRSILREDHNGCLEIISSFVPDLTSVTCNGQTIYSQLQNIVDDDISASDYVTAEKNFSYATTAQFFLPRTARTYAKTSYISDKVSQSNGKFTTNPTITFQWESSWTFFNMTILFNYAKPKMFRIKTYEYGTLINTITVTAIDFSTIVKHDFWNIDKIVIEFVETNPYQRIHIARIRFGNVTDYELDYSDMSETPRATTTEFVRNVNVQYSEFAYGTTPKKVSTTAAVIGSNFVTFNKPYHSYSLAFSDITDNEQTYGKLSKVYCTALPDAAEAKTNTVYLLTKSSTSYALYVVQTSKDVRTWKALGTFSESRVSALPSSFADNRLYLLTTDNPSIFHIYMLWKDRDTVQLIKTINATAGSNTTTFTADYRYYELDYNVPDDDDQVYEMKTKVYCSKLPSTDEADENTFYFIKSGSKYKTYNYSSDTKQWVYDGEYKVSTVNSFPTVVAANTIYKVTTATNVYHLYMLEPQAPPEPAIPSLVPVEKDNKIATVTGKVGESKKTFSNTYRWYEIEYAAIPYDTEFGDNKYEAVFRENEITTYEELNGYIDFNGKLYFVYKRTTNGNKVYDMYFYERSQYTPTGYTRYLYGEMTEKIVDSTGVMSSNVLYLEKSEKTGVYNLIISNDFDHDPDRDWHYLGTIARGDLTITSTTDNSITFTSTAKADVDIYADEIKIYSLGYEVNGKLTITSSADRSLTFNSTATASVNIYGIPISKKSLGYVVKGTLSVQSSGAYFVRFNSTVNTKVDITATEFEVNTKTVTKHLKDVGVDKTAKNVLLDSLQDAEDAVEWVGEYFSNDIEYDISYRGEPAIEPDDQIYTENKYVERNLVRIVDTQIDTSTGMSMSCKLKGRRTHYVEPAKVDIAIVDESIVSY